MIPFVNIKKKDKNNNVDEKILYGLNMGLHNGHKSVCGNKTRFKSEDQALNTIKSRGHKNKEVYLCPFCGYYHYGENRLHKHPEKLERLLDYDTIQILKIPVRRKNKLEDQFFKMVNKGW